MHQLCAGLFFIYRMEKQMAETSLVKNTGAVLFSRREAANYLGVGESTLAVWACVGRYDLPYVKIGRLAKYRKADLDAFIQKRTRLHTGEEVRSSL